MVCGVTWGFLAIVGLAILVVGIVIGAIVAIVGIDSQRRFEEER